MFGYITRAILVFSTTLYAVQALQTPEILLHPSMTAARGNNVTIDCAARGDPRPNVTLYRNGVSIQVQEKATFSPLIPNLGGARYTFAAVQGTEGPYECRATNGIADANGNTVIKKVINIIITEPQTSSPTTQPQSTTQTKSSTATKTSSVETEENKNTVSGSKSSSALSWIVVLSLVAIASFSQRW